MLPFGLMTVLVPLPFGTTIAPGPAGGVELAVTVGAAGVDCGTCRLCRQRRQVGEARWRLVERAADRGSGSHHYLAARCLAGWSYRVQGPVDDGRAVRGALQGLSLVRSRARLRDRDCWRRLPTLGRVCRIWARRFQAPPRASEWLGSSPRTRRTFSLSAIGRLGFRPGLEKV